MSSWFPSQPGTSGKLSAFLSAQLLPLGLCGVRLLHAPASGNAKAVSLGPVEPLERTRSLKVEFPFLAIVEPGAGFSQGVVRC